MVIQDFSGTIVLPPEAATRDILQSDGSTQTVVDARLIGPVYLGLYPSVVEGLEDYPSPERGPGYQTGIDGDAYPYGGTSLGDIRFACLEFFKCKVVSGRYVTFQDMVEWFNETLDTPITDVTGEVVTNGDYVADQCFDLLNYVDEEEIRLTVTEDVNEDGSLDKGDLEFVEQQDGSWQASFSILQQEYFENDETGQGFTLWGWMDAPSTVSNKFSTCEPEQGLRVTEYNRDFYAGQPYNDLLNFPQKYIAGGDYVASEAHVYQSPEDEVTLRLDFKVED
jgi:hypothetical protein